MKRTTKTKRLQMIVHEYERRNPGPFVMADVAEWALSVGLLPAPGRTSDEIEEAAEWDRYFTEIASEKVELDDA